MTHKRKRKGNNWCQLKIHESSHHFATHTISFTVPITRIIIPIISYVMAEAAKRYFRTVHKNILKMQRCWELKLEHYSTLIGSISPLEHPEMRRARYNVIIWELISCCTGRNNHAMQRFNYNMLRKRAEKPHIPFRKYYNTSSQKCHNL
jgi:hypothetical protein